jgi:hypothetical protein
MPAPHPLRRHRPAAQTGFALLLPLLASCASAAPPDTGQHVGGGDGFRMAVGEEMALPDDSRLRYLRLATDSRCPPEVRCVWAGDAIVEFAWTPASGAAQSFELHTGLEPRSHAVGNRRLVLVSLERGPEPAAVLRLEDSD